MFHLSDSSNSVLEYIASYVGFTSQDEALVREHASQLQERPEQLAAALLIFLEQHREIIEEFSNQSHPSTCYWLDQQVNIFDTIITTVPDKIYVETAVRRGRAHAQTGIPAICIIGIFEIYLKHAETLIDDSDFPETNKRILERALHKRLLLDKMLQVHGFNLATQEQKDYQSAQYAHLSRLYATLSHVSLAILHAGDRQTLFQSFCDAAVKHGFSYAWVVEPDWQNHLHQLAAIAGQTDFGLFRQQQVSSRSDSPLGNGPTGLALRTGEMQIINETQNLTSLDPWRQLFEQFQIRSMVAIPLKEFGKTTASFCLYVDEPDFFGENEITLVTVMAREISHVLERLSALQENNEVLTQLVWQRQHDELTGLPLRELFFRRVQGLLSHASDESQAAIALLAIDHFLELNSRYGHAVGDALLCMLSDLLQERVGAYGLVARLGGNCFAIVTEQPGWILPLLASSLKRIAVAQRILGYTLQITASIGVVMVNQHESPDELLRQARVALDKARRDGGNQSCVFDDALDAAIRQKELLQKNIRHALRNRELLPYFQPKIDLVTGKVLGAEALVRWHQGDRIMSPAEFLPGISSPDLIILIDWSMLNAVAEILSTPGCFSEKMQSVSVNLSMQTLAASDFTARLARLIDRHGLRPGQLELEVLETVVLHETSIIANLAACREMGCQIAVDDFGTAASSLVHLLEIPSDIIKIDQRFAQQLLNQKGNHAIISSMITYTQISNKKLCIEGVETYDIWHRLIEIGCTQGQGFAIAHPMILSDFENWLIKWNESFGWHINKLNKTK